MKSDLLKQFELQSQIFKALSHPTRLLIANELEKGKKCVYELNALNLTDKSTISKHLQVLKSAGIVSTEKKGSCVYYYLNMADIPDICKKIGKFIGQNLKKRWGKS